MLFAGTETSSGLIGRILQQLASHPDEQETLRAELAEAHRAARHELDYDKLTNLPHLDAICRETLRLYDPTYSCDHRFAHQAL